MTTPGPDESPRNSRPLRLESTKPPSNPGRFTPPWRPNGTLLLAVRDSTSQHIGSPRLMSDGRWACTPG